MISGRHFKELVENSHDGITLATDNGKIIYVNAALCRLVKRAAEEIIQHGRNILFKPGDKRLEEMLKIRDESGTARGEIEIIDCNNNPIPVEVSSVIYFDDAGVRYSSTIFRDISARKAMQRELLETRERFQVLSDFAFEGIAISINGVLQEVNNAMASMFGYERDELIGLPIECIVTEECKALVLEHIKQNYALPYQVIALRKDGSTFTLEVCGKSSFYKGKLARITSLRDITEKVIAEKEIKGYEVKFQTLYQHGSDMLGLINEKAEYVYVSPSVERILGYKPEEMVGKSATDFIHPEDLENALSKLAEVFTNKTATIPDFRFKHADGTYVWVETVLDNLLENKDVRAISASSRDITKRKLAELALRQREADLALALDNIHRIFNFSMDMICTIDAEGRFVDISASCQNIIGDSPNQLLGKSYINYVFEEDKQATINTFNIIKSGQPVINFENRYKHASGHLIDMLWAANWSEESNIMFCIGRNITELKRTTQELKLNEQKFRSLFENHPDTAVALDKNGVIQAANKNFLEMLELNIEDVLHENIRSFFIIDEDEVTKMHVGMAHEGIASTFDTETFSAKGKYIRTRITIIPIILDGEVTGTYLITKDITASWQNEQRLAATKKMLESATVNADLKEVLAQYLSHIERIYPSVSCSIQLLESNTYLNHYIAPSLPECYAKGVDGFRIAEVAGVGKAEDALGLPLISLDIDDETEADNLRSVLHSAGIEAYMAYPIITASGKPLGMLGFNYKDRTLLKQDDVHVLGEVTKLVTLVIDNRNALEAIKNKNTELQKINAELERFAYSTSHELRAPLTSIKGLVNLSLNYGKYSDDVFNCLKMIEKSALKLENFILQIGNYYYNKGTLLRFEMVNLYQLVEKSIANLKQKQDTENINFKIDIAPEFSFYADVNCLNIIFNNILLNAIKYSDINKPEQIVEISAARTRENILIKIKDNGIGIAEECKPKIWDMFYRGTEFSNGSGLGLYIVKEAIDKLKGDIKVYSQLNEGTTIEIILPVSQAQLN